MIIIGSDHAGYNLKEKIKTYLQSKSLSYKDVGCYDNSPIDYPLIGYALSKEVTNTNNIGIGICGSGVGMCMACNKIKGIRAVNCNTKEIAELSRKHNDANIICFGERLISYEDAILYLEIFLNTSFEGDRHIKRVKELNEGEDYER